ncbi:unnamed protein product [Parnassius mnemosyne]|uniref:Uncharacterized protein n=1 Tax=Parnassius mnemosyne TaxID=213953 RepID=A0AAV1LCX8_9NEOP
MLPPDLMFQFLSVPFYNICRMALDSLDSPTPPLQWLFLLFEKRISFQSIPKPHKVRDEIQFTPINHIDIWPVECDRENDCKDDIFCLDAVKVEEEIFEYENSKLEENENHETGKIFPFFDIIKIRYNLPYGKWLL